MARNGGVVLVGGKTGTGDNRYDTFGACGRLIGQRVVDRTATFVFFLGDRFFGTITAYVPGAVAIRYDFTSALAVQLLKALEPRLRPAVRDARDVGAVLGEGRDRDPAHLDADRRLVGGPAREDHARRGEPQLVQRQLAGRVDLGDQIKAAGRSQAAVAGRDEPQICAPGRPRPAWSWSQRIAARARYDISRQDPAEMPLLQRTNPQNPKDSRLLTQ